MDIAKSDKEILRRLALILPKEKYQKFWDIYMADFYQANEGFLVDVIEELTWLVHQLEDEKYILKTILEELKEDEDEHYN